VRLLKLHFTSIIGSKEDDSSPLDLVMDSGKGKQWNFLDKEGGKC
jgi:hypothetical protein